jgi:methylmalonyl-CoA/ethylmalonyl-CoA epimerase
VMSTYVGMGSGGRCGGWSVRSPPDDIPFAIKALKHIAIAVPDLTIAAEHYRTAFGAQVSDPVDKLVDGMTVVYVQLPNLCIELVHPLGEKSPVAAFLSKNPKGGIHHVCLAVSSNFPSP